MFSGAGVHALQSQLADSVFRVPPEQMHVACPDVGGGFGVKNALYPEWVMLLWAARALGRPVRWMSERAEDFITTAQGRDNVTRARLALDADGRFLALDVATVANLGAYLSSGGPGSSTNAPANAIGSGYVIPAIFMDVHGVFTNTVPIDAYRGAGKPEVNYMIERLIDEAARRCGFDAIELRRRNLVREFPYRKALGTVIDCGRFADNLDDAIVAADHAGFAARRERSQQRRQAARHRRDLLHGNRARRAERGRRTSLRRRWQRVAAGRHAVERHGSRDRLCADRRRSARLADRGVSLRAGGHRRRCAPATAMAARGPCTWAVPRCARRSMRCWRRAARLPLGCCRRRWNRWCLPMDASRYGASRIAPSICWRLARAARDPANLPDDMSPGLDTYVWNLLDLITFPNGCHIAEVEIDPETGARDAGTLHRGR